MKHDNTAYQNGCRCDSCRLAHSIYMNRYRAAREKRGGKITEHGVIGGWLYEPVAPTAKRLVALRRKLTLRRTAVECGISTRTVQEIIRRERESVHPRVASAVQRAWEDFCAPVPRDTSRWPFEPVRAAVVARYGSLKASPWRTQVARLMRQGDVSTDTAERWADRLGLHPAEIWGDWASYGARGGVVRAWGVELATALLVTVAAYMVGEWVER